MKGAIQKLVIGFRYQSSEAEEGVGLTRLSGKHAESVQSMLRRYSDIVLRSDFGLLWNWMEYGLKLVDVKLDRDLIFCMTCWPSCPVSSLPSHPWL